MSTIYRVWNEEKTEFFETKDKQLAYEVRKCSESNCYDENGQHSQEAVEFIKKWWEGNLTIETSGF
jgi:hypothetical protein